MFERETQIPAAFDVDGLLINEDTSLIDTIRVIDSGAMQIALAVDEDRRLVGVVTDGDVRRAILSHVALDQPVSTILNRHPLVVQDGVSPEDLNALIHNHNRILRIPLVDASGRLLGIYRAEDMPSRTRRSHAVVLMAGGLGSRLRPFTDDIPKPMLDIGGRPIIEHIIRRFLGFGFSHFYLSVNYRSEVIKSYFGDGKWLGAKIEYLEETERMGTAGSLRLLPPEVDGPFFVMNGDLLTAANFSLIMDYHLDAGAEATMCLREYTMEVPFGVVSQERGRLQAIREKPRHHHYVNAGIYVLNASVLKLLPETGYFDMPSLFDRIIVEDPTAASVFPLREYWCDIGRVEDLERARLDIVNMTDTAA